MDLAEVHVDAAGEGAAEGVVHDLHGIKVRGRAGDADAEGEERGLGGAGLVDDDETERGWRWRGGKETSPGRTRWPQS